VVPTQDEASRSIPEVVHDSSDPTDAMLAPASARAAGPTAKPTKPTAEVKPDMTSPRVETPPGPEAAEAASTRSEAPAPKARARHAHLFVTHLDPWSVMKNAFMFALAVAIVMIVAVTILWALLSLSGTLSSITRTLTDIAGGGANTLDAASLFSFSRVVGVTGVLAILEVILLTALTTLFAFLYNLAVGITGGLQVTLTDDS